MHRILGNSGFASPQRFTGQHFATKNSAKSDVDLTARDKIAFGKKKKYPTQKTKLPRKNTTSLMARLKETIQQNRVIQRWMILKELDAVEKASSRQDTAYLPEGRKISKLHYGAVVPNSPKSMTSYRRVKRQILDEAKQKFSNVVWKKYPKMKGVSFKVVQTYAKLFEDINNLSFIS
jgi:hypothetical protein